MDEHNIITPENSTEMLQLTLPNPVGWDCKIHRLHLCRGVTPPMSVLDMTLNNLMARLQPENFEEYGVPFIAIAPSSTLTRSSSTWYGPLYVSNRTM